MKHWRLVLILFLLATPIAIFFGVGVVVLWRGGQLVWLWWLLPACWGIAYLLSRCWRQQLVALPGPAVQTPLHWTSQDHAAWQLVQQQQTAVTQLPCQQLVDPHFYLQSAMDLALDVARHYHPRARDPVGSLTVPEVLAASQLAIEDSAAWVRDNVPGGQMLTVDQWRLLAKAPSWIRAAGNVSWAVSILFNPLNVGRMLASKVTVDSVSKQVQQNVLAWFYAVFMRYAGFYLIEMNSGRLRGGAAKYRELQRRLALRPLVAPPPAEVEELQGDAAAAVEVTIALVGQVNAGKSSLVNALLGDRRAAVDVLPTTKHVSRYRLSLEGAPDPLVVLDTAGYGNDGASAQDVEEVTRAAERADLVLLVADAANPAKRPDLELLDELRRCVESGRNKKLPPILVVLTHIDCLPPVLEWEPPYAWREPSTTKEQNIAGAVHYAELELQEYVAGVVPICSCGQRVSGVQEELIPSIVALLGEARACSLLRALHQDLESGQLKQLFQQFRSAGGSLLKAYLTGTRGEFSDV